MIERADISTHTRQHRFLQGAAYWCAFKTIGAGWPKPARVRGLGSDCFGSGWIGSLGAAGSSGNSVWLWFRLNFGELRFLCSTLYWRPSNNQDQPEPSSQWFAYIYFSPGRPVAHLFSPGWPVAPGRRPEYLPSADRHCLGAGDCFLMEANKRFVDHFYWPTIIPHNK